MTTASPRGQSSLSSNARYLGRLVLALLGFTVLLFPVFGLVMPPDPFTQLFGLIVLLPVALFAAVGFLRRGGSVRRLGRYLLAVYLLLIPLWIPFAAFVVLLRQVGVPYGPVDVVGQLVLLLVDYVGAYYLVYRGGYERLKARVARSV